MATRRVDGEKSSKTRRPMATTPEAQENRLIRKAVDLAERQLEDGTASAQVITHYLKLGSSREKLEQELIQENVALQKAKRENMASAARVEELYGAAINVMRAYAGQEPLPSSDEELD